MPGLRLTRPTAKTSAKPSLKFPAQAVRALPDWSHRADSGLRLRTPEEIEGGASSPDLAASVGQTIAHMQAKLDELRRDAGETLLFPIQSAVDGSSYDRPRAA
jgi:hypothetical protein